MLNVSDSTRIFLLNPFLFLGLVRWNMVLPKCCVDDAGDVWRDIYESPIVWLGQNTYWFWYTLNSPDIKCHIVIVATTRYGRLVDPGRVSTPSGAALLLSSVLAAHEPPTAAAPMTYSGRPRFCCHVSILPLAVTRQRHAIRWFRTSLILFITVISVEHSYSLSTVKSVREPAVIA